MERLTINNGEGIGVLKQPYQCERCGDLQWSLSDLGNGSPTDRLFEYEEVGCTPKQLLEIDHLYTELAREVMQYRKLGAVEQLREMQSVRTAFLQRGFDWRSLRVLSRRIMGGLIYSIFRKWVSMRNNSSGYPTQIHIKMSNGETIIYKR